MERRTVIKGAAWSVPVIAAAVAAPLAVASTTPGTEGGFRFDGNAWNNGKNPVEFSIHDDTTGKPQTRVATVVVEWSGGSESKTYPITGQGGPYTYALPEGVDAATFSITPATTKPGNRTTVFTWTRK